MQELTSGSAGAQQSLQELLRQVKRALKFERKTSLPEFSRCRPSRLDQSFSRSFIKRLGGERTPRVAGTCMSSRQL
jgi:hypothetical protein